MWTYLKTFLNVLFLSFVNFLKEKLLQEEKFYLMIVLIELK
jgi:hypothetical protein